MVVADGSSLLNLLKLSEAFKLVVDLTHHLWKGSYLHRVVHAGALADAC